MTDVADSVFQGRAAPDNDAEDTSCCCCFLEDLAATAARDRAVRDCLRLSEIDSILFRWNGFFTAAALLIWLSMACGVSIGR